MMVCLCRLLLMSKFMRFWGDQTDSKSACWGPNSILRTGHHGHKYHHGKIVIMVAMDNLRWGPKMKKSSNLHITADSTGSIHKNARDKQFDPKKIV